MVAVLAAGAFSVSDSPVKPVDPAAAVGCDASIGVWHQGNLLETYNFTSVKGLSARLNNAQKVQLCSGIPSDASTWIAVVPDAGQPGYGDTNKILQIGYGKNSLNGGGARIFMALGGCGQYTPTLQYPWGNFAPGSGWVRFRIWIQSNGDWAMDWLYEPTGTGGSLIIDNQDPAISCWINNPVMGQLLGETKNPANDNGFPTSHMYFRDILFRVSQGGTWWYPSQKHSSGLQMGFPTNCDYGYNINLPGPHEFHCDDPGTRGDALDVWVDHL
jgi:hypothetical protein